MFCPENRQKSLMGQGPVGPGDRAEGQHFVFFLASKPNCISHTIPDFSRAITQERLPSRIIEDAVTRTRAQTSTRPARRNSTEASPRVLEGHHWLKRTPSGRRGGKTWPKSSPMRRGRAGIAGHLGHRIYQMLPEFPAATSREGLTTLWICWIALHLENPDVGLSLGRLDQVLFDLYRQDVESPAQTLGAGRSGADLLPMVEDRRPRAHRWPQAGEQL